MKSKKTKKTLKTRDLISRKDWIKGWNQRNHWKQELWCFCKTDLRVENKGNKANIENKINDTYETLTQELKSKKTKKTLKTRGSILKQDWLIGWNQRKQRKQRKQWKLGVQFLC